MEAIVIWKIKFKKTSQPINQVKTQGQNSKVDPKKKKIPISKFNQFI